MDADPAKPSKLQKSDLAETRAHLRKARQEGFHPVRRDAVTERVSAAIAASGRPKFVNLLRKLRPGTALIVWKLDALGRDAADVLKTIRKVKAGGASIYCMEIYRDDISSNKNVMTTLGALAELDRATGKIRDVAGSLGRGVGGGRVGRPPSLDDATKAQVRACLAKGIKVSAVAKRFHTSRQTVLRIRDADG